MDVIVDGNRGFQFATPPSDILAAVADISNVLHAQGRALLSMRVDGQVVSPRALSETIGRKSTDEVRALEIYSESVGQLARQTLLEVEKVLDELPDICRELASVFQGQHPEEGIGPFGEFASIWRDVKDRETQAISILDIPHETLSLDGVPIAQSYQKLNQYLEEIAAALEARDYVLMGDLLEYEFAPRIESEMKIVRTLLSRAEERMG